MKTEIESFIGQLPDNDQIRRVSTRPKAFVIKSSELSKHDNWSPEFHDFKTQYQFILDRLVKSSSIADFRSFLSKAISDRKVKVGKHTYKLHPDVVQNLSTLL